MQAIQKALIKTLHRRSYFDFFCHFWDVVVKEELILNWHIKYLCDELQKVGERVINGEEKEYDLIINISPGESKSTIATVMYPVWLWVCRPDLRIISGSYAKDLAIEHAGLSRDIIRSDRFRELYGEIEMRKDTDLKSYYKNTLGGSRKAVSTGSAVTGTHAHMILIDDPLNPKMAASDVSLKNANEWINKTLHSRKVDKAKTPMVLIMQRLHENDPSGDWLSQEGRSLKHICIPADTDYPIYPAELESYYTNGVMNPGRTGVDVLAEQKSVMGSMEYAGQYGQAPAAAEGNLIKREWLTVLNRILPGPESARVDFVLDTAYTEKSDNDPTGILAYSVYKGRLYLWDYKEVRYEFGKLIKFIKEYVAQWGDGRSRVVIEPKASGISILQVLKETPGINAIGWKMPDGDKRVRLHSVSPIIEAGNVFIVGGAWNDHFITQLLTFPNAKHDEAVDCIVMALTEMSRGKNRVTIGEADYL